MRLRGLLTLSVAQFTSRNAAREFMEQLSVLEAATVPTEPGSAPVPVEAWSAGRRQRSEVVTSSLVRR